MHPRAESRGSALLVLKTSAQADVKVSLTIDSLFNETGSPQTSRWAHLSLSMSLYVGHIKEALDRMAMADLIKLINEYYSNPLQYATWTSPSYTPNAVLHGLRWQATIHYNTCKVVCSKHCVKLGKDHADRYMVDLSNGRHDLHPDEDDVVSNIAFAIHNIAVEKDPKHGRRGIMTNTYVRGFGSSEACQCYELGYQEWLKRSRERTLLTVPIDPDEVRWTERFV